MTTSRRVVIILLALSLIAGVSTGVMLYYRLAYVWIFLFFGSWIWSIFSVRGIKLERSARTVRAQVGQIFEERFEIQNSSRLPRLWLEIKDESKLPGSEGSRVLMMIEGRQGRSYLARTRLVQRGVFPLGPTVVASGDIFGLFPASLRVPFQESVTVFPLMAEVQSFPNPPGLLPGGEALRRRTHQVTPNAAGVREYVHGDPLNRIHWLSSARRNRLMVKEFELDPLADVWIFMDAAQNIQFSLPRPEPEALIHDFWQKDYKTTLPPTTEEYAVSVAASLARNYLRRGRAVGLVTVGQYLTLLPPDRGGRQLGKILEGLALLRAEGDMPLRGLVETQAKHIARGSTAVLITPSVHKETAMLFDYLLRRGLRPIAVLLDAATFGGPSGTDTLAIQIKAMGIPLRVVPCGVELEKSLSSEYNIHMQAESILTEAGTAYASESIPS